MPKLIIGNDEGPITEKRTFTVRFEDLDEKETARDVLDELVEDGEDPYGFQSNLEGDALDAQIPDDEVGEIVDLLSGEWPQLDATMDEWREKMITS